VDIGGDSAGSVEIAGETGSYSPWSINTNIAAPLLHVITKFTADQKDKLVLAFKTMLMD